jgi:cytochrome c
MFLSIKTPVPNDIPLELPLPEWLLVVLLIVSFLAHIVFVNVMVGGSILTLWGQIKGLKNKDYDVFAHEVAKTITVNKSIAVVLGVAPLLCINTLYTVYFYSANALTGFLAEFIIYNAALTTAERQQVEGYLAWKWGLNPSLPTTHPYYKVPT